MDCEFWLRRWETSQIGFHQSETNPTLRARWDGLGIPPGATVFVPLCGKSRDMLWLLAKGHPVVGVELSRIAVRDFFAENDLTPSVAAQGKLERWRAGDATLFCGDFFDLTRADVDGAAAVYDRAALIALPPELRQRYAKRMRELLPAARTLLITASYPEGEMQGPPFSVTEAEVRRLYSPAEVSLLSSVDALAENPQLRARGLTRLTEQVFQVA